MCLKQRMCRKLGLYSLSTQMLYESVVFIMSRLMNGVFIFMSKLSMHSNLRLKSIQEYLNWYSKHEENLFFKNRLEIILRKSYFTGIS